MKKFVIIFFMFPFLLKSQVYTAGQLLQGYVDINPDTLIDYPSGPPYPGWLSPESYSIDVNGDSQKDLTVESWFVNSPAGLQEIIRVKSLNSNCFIRRGRVDSVYNSYYSSWAIDNVVKPLVFGDTINKIGSVWLNSSYLTISNQTNYGGTVKNIQDWVSPNDEYIGVKYQTSTDTLIGWIRVNVPVAAKCYIKDYSFSCKWPVPNVVSSSSLICSGASATLTASGSTSYNWSNGSYNNPMVVSPSVTTTYYVNGFKNGCFSTAVITQSVKPTSDTPTVTAITSNSEICTGESSTLTATGAPSYTWSTGSNSTSIVVSPVSTINYSVSGSYTTGCKNTFVITQTVNACIGINEIEALQKIILSPNPANDKIYIQNPMNIGIKGISLQSIEGKEILVFENKNEIVVNSISEGIYFLKLETDKGILTRKIIIQH